MPVVPIQNTQSALHSIATNPFSQLVRMHYSMVCACRLYIYFHLPTCTHTLYNAFSHTKNLQQQQTLQTARRS